jgi:hypothetical protein
LGDPALLQKLLKMKLSSGKLQFWEWKKFPVDAGTFFTPPNWYFTFFQVGNAFRPEDLLQC